MSGSRRQKFEDSLDFRGRWRNPLPPSLRIAAELQFGTVILFAILIGVKEGPAFGLGGILMAVMAWLHTHFRAADSPANWWISVVLFTVAGAFFSVAVVMI